MAACGRRPGAEAEWPQPKRDRTPDGHCQTEEHNSCYRRRAGIHYGGRSPAPRDSSGKYGFSDQIPGMTKKVTWDLRQCGGPGQQVSHIRNGRKCLLLSPAPGTRGEGFTAPSTLLNYCVHGAKGIKTVRVVFQISLFPMCSCSADGDFRLTKMFTA